jgi:hypothetical protein
MSILQMNLQGCKEQQQQQQQHVTGWALWRLDVKFENGRRRHQVTEVHVISFCLLSLAVTCSCRWVSLPV